MSNCGRFLIIMLLLMTSPAAAREGMKGVNWEDPAKVLVELEDAGIKAGLRSWEDAEVIVKLSKKEITEDLITGLYYNFKNVVVNPPNPAAPTKYTIENKESLDDMESLGRLLHNLYLSLSEKDLKKYGTLIGLMRAVLFIDIKHIPFALRDDNSSDFLWYEAHAKGIKAVDKEYEAIFEK